MAGTDSAAATRFLDPAVLAGTDNLLLLARSVVEGFLAGRHLDIRPGPGVEFSQYRSYQPGDDLRRVDWRVYGRSDRLMVRDADVERDVTVRIVLDASRSMLHAEPSTTPAGSNRLPGPGLDKLHYARMLAASIAYLAERQGDRIAFHAPTDRDPAAHLEPYRSGHDLVRLCTLLAALEVGGRWPQWSALAPVLAGSVSAKGGRGRQLIVLISDLYQHDDEMLDALRALTAARHEVLVLQVLGRYELELGWRGDLVFEDLETGETVRADADALRPDYRRRMSTYLDDWRRRIRDLGADHHLLITDQPLDRALRALLLRRQALP